MNFAVPDSEKRVAEKAEEQFENLLARLKVNSEFLGAIYEPFKRHQNIDSDILLKYRKTFRDYRDEVQVKYEKALKSANKCMVLMSEFGTDTVIEKMMDSFISLIKEIEKDVNAFLSIFSNIDDPEFKTYVITCVDAIRKRSNQVKQIVNDRILDHIETNILAKNWADNLSERFQEKIKEKVPLVVQLFHERQKALKESKI
jgi:hypothetical protein